MAGLTHRQAQELLGAYALHAVDQDEAAEVEDHVGTCPKCRDELAGHREAAAMLASVGAPAPEGVWDRIAADIGVGSGVGGGLGGGAEVGVGADADVAAAAARITELADARAGRERGTGGGAGARAGRRPWASRRGIAAVLTAAAVVVVALGVQLVRVDRRLADVQDVAAARSIDEAALFATANPDARRVRLSSDDGSRVADAVLLPDGQGYFLPRSLPDLSQAETYQLWAVIGDQKISVGVLGPSPKVTAFHFNAEPSVLAVTAEQSGGVVASEKRAVVVGVVEPKSA